MALTQLTPANCDEIFTPVLGSLIAVSMAETMMRTSVPDRSAKEEMHTDPDRVATASMMVVLQNFRERYINSTHVKDPFFRFGGHAQEDIGNATTATSERTDEIMKLQSSLISSMVANLGTTCFGYVFERYLKLTGQKSDQCEHAFEFQAKTQWRVFHEAYPSAHCNVPWNPTGINWLSRMIRNSFAHGGWTIHASSPPTITLRNWDPRQGKSTFDITMSISDLRNLIYNALQSFICNVQPPPPSSGPGHVESPPSLSHEIVMSFIDAHATDTARRSVGWS